MITVKEILEKYPTEFNLENMTYDLYNTTIIPVVDGDDHTINEVEKPTHTQTNDGHKYTYKVDKYTITIDNYLNTFSVDVKWSSPEGSPNPYHMTWDSNGTPLL